MAIHNAFEIHHINTRIYDSVLVCYNVELLEDCLNEVN